MGLISRVKTWIFQEDVASSDLNAEFDNILNNLDSAHIVGDSASVGQMQTTTSPGGVGSESLAANAQGEIERLRFVVQRILGAAASYWYSTPIVDLTTINSTLPALASIQNSIISAAVDANGQPQYLIADGTTNKVTLKCSVTPLSCYINGTQYTFNADISLTGLTLAPGANNTALIGNNIDGTSITSDAFSKNFGEEDSQDLLLDVFTSAGASKQRIAPFISLTTVGSALTALDATQVAVKINAEYSIGTLRGTASRIENCLRGCFFSNTSSALPRVGFATGDTVTLMKLSYIFLLSSGTLDVTYNRPSVGAQTPSSPATGDYWYDTNANQWKKYNGTSFAANASVFVGLAVQDSTKTVCSRSADFLAAYSDTAKLFLKRDSLTNTKISSPAAGAVSVYGKSINFGGNTLDFSISRDQSGAFSAGDLLFFYLSPTGKQFIDNVAPNKRPDLGGYYHPSRPYRCLGSSFTNNGTDVSASNVKNAKGVNDLKYRSQRIVLPATSTNTNMANISLGQIQMIARGGRLRFSFPPVNGVSFPALIKASNSGANSTTTSIGITITDEFSLSYTKTIAWVNSSGGALTTEILSKFSFILDEVSATFTQTIPASGYVNIAFALNTITAGGTGTFAIDQTPIVVEEIF